MSSESSDTTVPSQFRPPGLTEKQYQLLAYLHHKVQTKTYFKSKEIARDLDMSAKEIGTNIPSLIDADTGLHIERWGYSTGTTWKVTVDQ